MQTLSFHAVDRNKDKKNLKRSEWLVDLTMKESGQACGDLPVPYFNLMF